MHKHQAILVEDQHGKIATVIKFEGEEVVERSETYNIDDWKIFMENKIKELQKQGYEVTGCHKPTSIDGLSVTHFARG